jgi:hypothetical protein
VTLSNLQLMFCLFRFPHIKTPKMCPPPGKKSTKNDDYVESEVLGVLSVEYDIHLHYAIAHMRRADGALPPHPTTGRKPLNLLAGKGQPRCDPYCKSPL